MGCGSSQRHHDDDGSGQGLQPTQNGDAKRSRKSSKVKASAGQKRAVVVPSGPPVRTQSTEAKRAQMLAAAEARLKAAARRGKTVTLPSGAKPLYGSVMDGEAASANKDDRGSSQRADNNEDGVPLVNAPTGKRRAEPEGFGSSIMMTRGS